MSQSRTTLASLDLETGGCSTVGLTSPRSSGCSTRIAAIRQLTADSTTSRPCCNEPSMKSAAHNTHSTATRTLTVTHISAHQTGLRRSSRYPIPLACDRPLLVGSEAKGSGTVKAALKRSCSTEAGFETQGRTKKHRSDRMFGGTNRTIRITCLTVAHSRIYHAHSVDRAVSVTR